MEPTQEILDLVQRWKEEYGTSVDESADSLRYIWEKKTPETQDDSREICARILGRLIPSPDRHSRPGDKHFDAVIAQWPEVDRTYVDLMLVQLGHLCGLNLEKILFRHELKSSHTSRVSTTRALTLEILTKVYQRRFWIVIFYEKLEGSNFKITGMYFGYPEWIKEELDEIKMDLQQLTDHRDFVFDLAEKQAKRDPDVYARFLMSKSILLRKHKIIKNNPTIKKKIIEKKFVRLPVDESVNTYKKIFEAPRIPADPALIIRAYLIKNREAEYVKGYVPDVPPLTFFIETEED
jgi:hypothetical protein